MKTMSAVLFALFLASFAQAQQTWTRTYRRADSSDEGYSVRQTLDGGYIIAGWTTSYGAGRDVYLIKTNAAGDTQWTRTYGYGEGRSVQQTSDGGYIIAGSTYSPMGRNCICLVKTNAAGNTQWTKAIGDTCWAQGRSVQQTLDGGYIIAGHNTSFATSTDFYLAKTNALGDTQWTRTYGGIHEEYGYCVRQTSDGGYIFTGSTVSFGHGGSDSDVWLIRTNAFGDTQWTRTYGGTGNEVGYSVQQTLDGGYIIAGSTGSFGHGGDVYLIKTDTSGDTLWTRACGGVDVDVGYSVQQTSDGGYIIAGGTWVSVSCALLVKTDSSGDTLWTRIYHWGPSGNDCLNSVQQTLDGGYIATGLTVSLSGIGDVYVIKTDANGSVSVDEQGSRRQEAGGSMRVTPNPFVSFARIPGHEAERFKLYDISGKMVGAYPGNRIGEGLSPAVYFVKLDGKHGKSLRIVKVK